MGYAVYPDIWARDYGVDRWAGYGVPAICDFVDCNTQIDRGMGYRCEEYTEYTYFDADGQPCTSDDDWEDERWEDVEGCNLHFCSDHWDHDIHADSEPKPDTAEWEAHILSDESWAEWRQDNPAKVEQMIQRKGDNNG